MIKFRSISVDAVADEMLRQAEFQLPRVGQSSEQAYRNARALAKIVQREHVFVGDFVEAVVPNEWFTIRRGHVDAPRQTRLHAMGGSGDPVLSLNLVWDGRNGRPLIDLENGNNRIRYDRDHGIPTHRVYLPEKDFRTMVDFYVGSGVVRK